MNYLLFKRWNDFSGWLVFLIAAFYKRQNKMFHFHKTFCSKFSFINTKQNVHFIPFEYALNEIKASNTANS